MKSWREEWANRLDDMCEIKPCALPIKTFPFDEYGKDWILSGREMTQEELEKLLNSEWQRIID